MAEEAHERLTWPTRKIAQDPSSGGQALLGSVSAPQSPTKYGTFTQSSRRLRTSRSYRSIAKESSCSGGSSRPQTPKEKGKVWYDNYTAIDFNRDQVLEATRLEQLRSRSDLTGRTHMLVDSMQGWILCLLIGVVTAVVAYVIMLSEVFFYSAKLGYCADSIFIAMRDCPADRFVLWQRYESLRFINYVLIALIYAVLVSLLTMATITVFPSGKKFYMAAGSGIPEIKIILSGFVIHGFLGVKTLMVKAVGLTLAVATGMALGKEGPFVMISCCIANILTRLSPKFVNNETKRREILSSACAAGVAVAFGSPIGGVLFALEEVSYYFPPKVMHRSFFCAAVAAVTLKSLNPHGTGKLVLLETNYEWKDWHTTELPIFLLLGILGGLYGAAFCALNMKWSRSFRRLKFVAAHPVLEVVLIVVITSAISYWSDLTQIGGTELVDKLLSECSADDPGSLLCPKNRESYVPIIWSLLWALLVRSALVVVTFGIKLPAGIFVPTMVVGALAGRVVGLLLEHQYQLHSSTWFFHQICPKQEAECIVPGIYAMIGAAATLAGVTRMTVSLAVIMFELTGSLSYVLPYMIAIMTAKWTADAFDSRGIYELIIDLNDHPYINVKENTAFGSSSLLDLLPSKAITLQSSIDVTHGPKLLASILRSKVHWAMENGYDDAGFAITSEDRLVGYIAVSDLSLFLDLSPSSKADNEVLVDPTRSSEIFDDDRFDLRTVIDQSPLAVQKEAPLELANEMFKKLGLRYLAVLDRGTYLGIVHKKRFVKFLRDGS